MSKNIVIYVIIVVIIVGLIFVLAQQYVAQTQRRATEITIPATSAKPTPKEAFVGGIAATTSEQDIQNIDIGDVKSDFKAVDADINSL